MLKSLTRARSSKNAGLRNLRAKSYCRSLATTTVAAGYDASKIRNMALVAHIDSGKTTLTESILLNSSYLSSSGTVDTGSTTTDFLPAERERGITIQSASIPVKWKDWTFNLIDTPGHADFGMEVESASRVVDGAVVLIDSVEGVESQTKAVWRQLDRYGVGTRIMFLNKLDRPGASFKHSLLSLLAHRLHPKPMVLTLPIASFDPQDYARAEPGIQGLVDLVNWEVWKWDGDGVSTRHPLPREIDQLGSMDILPESHPVLPHLVPARTALLENLSMFSEELMEILLNLPSSPSPYLGVDSSIIIPHLRAASLRNDVLPVLCGSAMRSIGTELVMNYVGELLASPLDVQHGVQSADAPLRLLAWKVGWDPKKGWMTYVRIYSGTLKRHNALWNSNRDKKERPSKILLMYASRTKEVDELPFGSVGVITGLKYTRTGDTLVSAQDEHFQMPALREIIPPPAVMSASVVPLSHSDLNPVQSALQSLARTDPSVRVDVQDGQILIHGLGALHLEIVEGRLRDEFDARFEFGHRRVSYREGLSFELTKSGDEPERWFTNVAGKEVFVSLDFSLRPLEDNKIGDSAWDGNIVLDENGQPLLPEASGTGSSTLRAHLGRGIATALSSSPHTSLAMSHVHVQVHKVSVPSWANPSIVASGAAVLLRNRMREAGMGPIMEPYIRYKVTVNEDSLGRVVRDLRENGAEVTDLGADATGTDSDEGPYPQDGVYVPPEEHSTKSYTSSSLEPRLRRTIRGTAPLNKMLDYSSRLRALSGGHGLFETANAGFRVVSESRKTEILKEIGRL